MAKYVLPMLFIAVIASSALISGCYNADEPLVVIGDMPGSSSSNTSNDSNYSTSTSESDQVHSLRRQLANSNKKCRDLEEDKDELKDKLKKAEKRIDRLEDDIEDLEDKIKDLRKD